MRMNKNKHHTKLILIILIIVALLVGGGVFAWFSPLVPFFGNKPQQDTSGGIINYDSPTTEQQKAGNQAKQDFINRTNANQGGTDKGDDGSSSGSSVNITISHSGTAGDVYQLRTIISAIDDNGTCLLTLSSSGKDNITQSVPTQSLGSYSVCAGFDIPTSQMGSSEWNAEIVYKGEAGQATVKQTIRVQ